MSRSLEEEYLDRVRAYRDTEAYRKAPRKRAVWVEPLFGEAKEWHGLRRIMLRGLEKVNTEALLKRGAKRQAAPLAFGSRGPRKPAQVAALRRPEDLCPGRFHKVRRHRRKAPLGPAGRFSTRWYLPRTHSGE